MQIFWIWLRSGVRMNLVITLESIEFSFFYIYYTLFNIHTFILNIILSNLCTTYLKKKRYLTYFSSLYKLEIINKVLQNNLPDNFKEIFLSLCERFKMNKTLHYNLSKKEG